MISLKPPAAPSLQLDRATFQPFISQYFTYMRYRSPAKSAASSPPVPPRISTMAFLSSCGSAGTRSSLISSSSSGMRASQAAASSRAISLISGSVSAIIRRASSKPLRHCIYSLRAFMISFSSLYSFVSLTYLFWSAMTFGSVMSVDTSSKRDTNPSSFSNSVLFSAIYELTELAFNNQFLLVAFFYTADNLCVDIE